MRCSEEHSFNRCIENSDIPEGFQDRLRCSGGGRDVSAAKAEALTKSILEDGACSVMLVPRAALGALYLVCTFNVVVWGSKSASKFPIVHLHRATIDTRRHPQR
jgi:hypothetical protein